MMNDQQFLRYSRQLLLEEIGSLGQQQLSQASILIVGLGGLGSPAALYLAAAGVGKLILADCDSIDLTNLQRQILFRTQDIQQSKAQVAKQQLQLLNPDIEYQVEEQPINAGNLPALIHRVDVVLDCSDNMITRHAINAACVAHQIPLVSGSAISFSGQLMVLTPPFEYGCYACLYPQQTEVQRNCRNSGVLGPIVGTIGSLQALETIRLLTEGTSALNGKLHLFDGKQHRWNTLKLKRDPQCQVCRGMHENKA